MSDNYLTQKTFTRVSVIGLGYIGLPTAAVLASRKIEVIGIDISKQVVDTINKGLIHIVEPDLDILVHSVVTEGYLKASIVPEPADAFLIAVPTPFHEGNQPNLDYIKSACAMIAPVLKQGDLIVLESTSPVGTTEKIADWLAVFRPDLSFPQNQGTISDIRVAYCPERVLPGHVLRELVQNDRLIGGMTPICSTLAANLYRSFIDGECIITNSRTAEMCKLTENSFRDVNIAFANELSLICDKLDLNVWDVIKLSNRHPRVNILKPGPGVGGHCIAVDPWFIVSQTPEYAKLIRSAREINDEKPNWVLGKVKLAIQEILASNPSKQSKDVVIACFGLAFKADIDDIRESPSLEIVKNIMSFHSGPIIVVEPYLNALPESLGGGELSMPSEAFEEADILLMLVAHKQFVELYTNTNVIPNARIIDVCGIWESRI